MVIPKSYACCLRIGQHLKVEESSWVLNTFLQRLRHLNHAFQRRDKLVRHRAIVDL